MLNAWKSYRLPGNLKHGIRKKSLLKKKHCQNCCFLHSVLLAYHHQQCKIRQSWKHRFDDVFVNWQRCLFWIFPPVSLFYASLASTEHQKWRSNHRFQDRIWPIANRKYCVFFAGNNDWLAGKFWFVFLQSWQLVSNLHLVYAFYHVFGRFPHDLWLSVWC